MTAKFARFAILKTLPLQKYERQLRRQLRLASKRRERLDNLELRKYLIDDNGAYLIDDHPVIERSGSWIFREQDMKIVDDHAVIERNGSTAHTPGEEAGTPIEAAHEASVEVHAPRETDLDAREMRAIAWLIIVIIASGYFIFGAPIKDQLASWGFIMIVVSLIWPWLGPWLQNPVHRRLVGWLGLLVGGLLFLAYLVRF